MLIDQVDVSFGDDGDSADPPGGDEGSASGDAGDGGAFSPLANALCDFALDVEGATFVNAALADLLPDGHLERPDLQGVAPSVHDTFRGREAEFAAAFTALFPKGLGTPLRTTAGATTSAMPGRYFLPVPPGVPGFVRCRPPEATNLVLSTFVRARNMREILTQQDVTPVITVISNILIDVRQTNPAADLGALKEELLRNLAPIQIFLTEDRNGNGLLDPGEDDDGNGVLDASYRVTASGVVPDMDLALLAFAAAVTFDAMRLTRASLPQNVTFQSALTDFFSDGSFSAPLAPLAPIVQGAVNVPENRAVLGTSDVTRASTTGTLRGTVTAMDGTPLAGARVIATQGSTQVGATTTATDGTFTLDNAPAGAITVTASLADFFERSVSATGVAVVTTSVTVALPPNNPPVASAGNNQAVSLGATVSLDGRSSSDPDGTPVSFLWSLISSPAGSAARLSDPTAAQPTLTTDVPGLYTVQLVVNDGNRNSPPSIVTIRAVALFVLNRGNDTITRYDWLTGALRNAFALTVGGGLDQPHSLVFGPDNHLYVSDIVGGAILRYDGATGAFLNTFVPAGSGGLCLPAALDFSPVDGHLYVVSGCGANPAILRYERTTGALWILWPRLCLAWSCVAWCLTPPEMSM